GGGTQTHEPRGIGEETPARTAVGFLTQPSQSQPHVGEDQSALVQLVEPGRGDTTQPARGEDPLVGGVVLVPPSAVRRGEGGPVTGGLQGFSGSGDQGIVDVDRCDQSRSQALTQQGGVVA